MVTPGGEEAEGGDGEDGWQLRETASQPPTQTPALAPTPGKQGRELPGYYHQPAGSHS